MERETGSAPGSARSQSEECVGSFRALLYHSEEGEEGDGWRTFSDGVEGDEEYAWLDVYLDVALPAARVVGYVAGMVPLNMGLHDEMKYTALTETFHTFMDTNGTLFGCSFYSEEDANGFYGTIYKCFEQINLRNAAARQSARSSLEVDVGREGGADEGMEAKEGNNSPVGEEKPEDVVSPYSDTTVNPLQGLQLPSRQQQQQQQRQQQQPQPQEDPLLEGAAEEKVHHRQSEASSVGRRLAEALQQRQAREEGSAAEPDDDSSPHQEQKEQERERQEKERRYQDRKEEEDEDEKRKRKERQQEEEEKRRRQEQEEEEEKRLKQEEEERKRKSLLEEEAEEAKRRKEEEEEQEKRRKEEQKAAEERRKEEEQEAGEKRRKEEEQEAAEKRRKEEEQEAAEKRRKEEEQEAAEKCRKEEEEKRRKREEEEEQAERDQTSQEDGEVSGQGNSSVLSLLSGSPLPSPSRGAGDDAQAQQRVQDIVQKAFGRPPRRASTESAASRMTPFQKKLLRQRSGADVSLSAAGAHQEQELSRSRQHLEKEKSSATDAADSMSSRESSAASLVEKLRARREQRLQTVEKLVHRDEDDIDVDKPEAVEESSVELDGAVDAPEDSRRQPSSSPVAASVPRSSSPPLATSGRGDQEEEEEQQQQHQQQHQQGNAARPAPEQRHRSHRSPSVSPPRHRGAPRDSSAVSSLKAPLTADWLSDILSAESLARFERQLERGRGMQEREPVPLQQCPRLPEEVQDELRHPPTLTHVESPQRPILVPRDWRLHVWKPEEFHFLGPKTMTNLKHQLEEYKRSLFKDMRREIEEAKSQIMDFVHEERESFAQRFSPPGSSSSGPWIAQSSGSC